MFSPFFIDIAIVLLILYYGYKGYVLGFWYLISRLLVLAISFVAAFLLYQPVGAFVQNKFQVFPAIAYGLSFIALLIIIQIILNIIFHKVINRIPENIRNHKINKIAGIPPGLVDGLITIIFITFLIFIAPFPPVVKDQYNKSILGNFALNSLSNIEAFINQRFGGLLDQALTSMTTRPDSNESVKLPFKPAKTTVNEKAEAEILVLLNEERKKVGVAPVVIDPTIIPVARAHSKDMWERQYFSHESPDGGTLEDRLVKGNVKYLLAGENLALAQNVELAHRGLMNSPGHKRNILDPKFTRIGIGVMDGGIYGKMFTQNFAN